MIIFDELPLVSLLDENREIDRVRYPNFSRLAGAANWYRNTTAVHYSTANATGGLLVGGEFAEYLKTMHGKQVALSGPIDPARVPASLFSLLENDYRTVAMELVTNLAPDPEEAGEYLPPLVNRVQDLLLDSIVVYGHIVVPGQYREMLPTVEGQWRGFWGSSSDVPESVEWPYSDSHGRLSKVKRFIDSFQKTNRPTFYFLHSLLPHFPFVYNEAGQLHANKLTFLTMHFREAHGFNSWPDETTATLTQQAHLLQLSFTDLLLGLVLDRLNALDLFDNSLIIVTSDHGTSYYWDSSGLPRETLQKVQAAETMYVPLLIKLPGNRGGMISDSPVRTIDILPTVADILGMETTWEVGGVSALGNDLADRDLSAYLPGYLSFRSVVDPEWLSLGRKLEVFGEGNIESAYFLGPHREVIGRAVSEFPATKSNASIKVVDAHRFSSVNPQAPRVPAYVEGRITGLAADIRQGELAVAVAVNGIIRNTILATKVQVSGLAPQPRNPADGPNTSFSVSGDPAGEVYFLVRIPPGSFQKGSNEVSIHGLTKDDRSGQIRMVEFKEE
jgi:hypothetical protein